MQLQETVFLLLIRNCFKTLMYPQLLINILWILLSLRNLEFSMGMACTSG